MLETEHTKKKTAIPLKKSQNYRIVEVGRDFHRSFSPASPAQSNQVYLLIAVKRTVPQVLGECWVER